jgi:hypothetical protein
VYAANELRNKIAHTFEQAKIKAKMDALRAAYLTALTPTRSLTSPHVRYDPNFRQIAAKR